MTFLPPYVYFIAISFFASLSTLYVKESPLYLKLFSPFLLATLIVESVGAYLPSVDEPNVWLYNFFTVIEFAFYLLVISLIVTDQKWKRIIRVLLMLYVSAAVINILFIQRMQAFHTVTYALGCLLIVFVCIYYFLELFKHPKSVRLSSNPAFWLCSGLLFFYCCGFPLYGLTNFISGISRLIIKNFFAIIVILNCFLYALFTIAFLCRLKIRKYISSR
jgi:hypothetical protein